MLFVGKKLPGQYDPVQLKGIISSDILDSELLNNWLSGFDTSKYHLHEVRIQSAEYWGDHFLSFVAMNVTYSDKSVDTKITRRVVLTPNSVACLIRIFNTSDETHSIALVIQDRLVIGNRDFTEALAGRLNKRTDAKTQMLAEIKEESGIEISEDRLQYLGKAFSSCGIISEQIFFFTCTVHLSPTQIEALKNGSYGVADENESTKVSLFSPNTLLNLVSIGMIEDQKLLSALGLLASKYPSKPLSDILESKES